MGAMKLLVDTHAVLWWLADDKQLSRAAKKAMQSRNNTLFVSAASVWEIATKHRLGKLPGVAALMDDLPGHLQRSGFELLSISAAHAELAGSFVSDHRDPFDRMLAAQARLEPMPIVSVDPALHAFGVDIVW